MTRASRAFAALDGRMLLALVLLVASASRNIWRHFDRPWPVVATFAALLAIFWFTLRAIDERGGPLGNMLHSRWLLYVLATVVGVAGYVLYARVDGLGLGSTSDDAFMLPIQALLAGAAPYGVKLFDGAPISPGPGWLLLNLPFGFVSLHALLTPLYCIACTYAFARRIGENSNLPLLLCMATPIFWSLVGSGSDLVALAFALPLCLLLVENHLRDNFSLIWLALLIGSITTARIVFSPLPLLIGLLFLQRDRALAIRFALTATVVNGIWHGVFYMGGDVYPPLHLFDRAARQMGFGLIAIGAFAALLLAGLLVRWCGNDFASRLSWFAGVLVLVLGVVAFGELRAVHYQPELWEGASYLYVALPTLVFAACAGLYSYEAHAAGARRTGFRWKPRDSTHQITSGE